MKTTEQNISTFSENEQENFLEETLKANWNYNSETEICVDVNLIEPLMLKDWLIENAKYFSDKEPNISSVFNIETVDMSHEYFPTWLVNNQDYIRYDLSGNNIENMHKVDVVPNEVSNRQVDYTLTLKEIKDMITLQEGNFETDKYNKHVCFYVDKGKMSIKLISFEPAMNCFSFPLLRQIVISNKLDDKSIFNFKVLEDESIFFYVEVNQIKTSYYDFSHIPTIKGYLLAL